MLTSSEVRALLRAAAEQLAVASVAYQQSLKDEPPSLKIAPAHHRPLSPLQRRILAVADATPAKAVTIANRINARFGTRHQAGGGFRSALAELVAMGLLAKGQEGWGYRLIG